MNNVRAGAAWANDGSVELQLGEPARSPKAVHVGRSGNGAAHPAARSTGSTETGSASPAAAGSASVRWSYGRGELAPGEGAQATPPTTGNTRPEAGATRSWR